MNELVISCIVISLLHAMIPNHSLPIIAIGKRFDWGFSKLMMVSFLAAGSHVLSTIIIGLVLALVGLTLSHNVELMMTWVLPALLIGLGIYFIWQHHTHNHFHLDTKDVEKSSTKIIMSLVLAMFFSPCLEIEVVFLAAGNFGWLFVTKLVLIYTVISIIGMLLWVGLAYKGLKKIDSHKIEHNIGLITGAVLILTGIAFLFIH